MNDITLPVATNKKLKRIVCDEQMLQTGRRLHAPVQNRQMMKKKWMLRSFVVLIALAISITAVGCGNTSNNGVIIGGNPNSSNTTGESYAFVHNNVKVTPNDLVDPLIVALGADYAYHESPSCAYTGLDKCYVYKGFSIYTYPDDKGVDRVLQVVLTDDSLSTPEGLMIGDTAQKVIELYGEDYKESNGSYAYTREKTTLMVIMKNGRVLSIQYGYTDAL